MITATPFSKYVVELSCKAIKSKCRLHFPSLGGMTVPRCSPQKTCKPPLARTFVVIVN